MEKPQNNYSSQKIHVVPKTADQKNDMANFSKVSDVEIWEAFKQGDEEAFNYIYRMFVPGMYNYGVHLVSDEGIVKDCIQILFINIRRKRAKLSKVNNIRGYLYTILYRELIKMYEKKNNVSIDSLEYSSCKFPIEVSHETKLIREELTNERLEQLELAMEKLPARQREALLLLYKEGLSYKDITEIMGFKDIKYARNLIYRGLENLRSKIL
ncbi:RNA polymerase sigma factor [Echinicola marina]|uniref:RNA polymerase sigma factor n=1 Tax=Echinicola marina TaxID=2859768 RepID=UPI001CF7056F|nr:RNA polymerase sigma factor [Echinicola marina]UCS92199.1 RNA polymerase sigma factor [Echinicola marina]